jgi:hypothetical protein
MAKYYVIYFLETVIDNEHEWCIHELSKQQLYKVIDQWLGPDAMEVGYATSYSYSVILLRELP